MCLGQGTLLSTSFTFAGAFAKGCCTYFSRQPNLQGHGVSYAVCCLQVCLQVQWCEPTLAGALVQAAELLIFGFDKWQALCTGARNIISLVS